MKLTKFANLINSGETFKDKCAILNFFFDGTLKESVSINNEFGKFYFPIGYNPWQSSTKSRPELFKEFDIEKGTFVDVGAMIGKYSLMVSANPKVTVVSIEPAPDNFDVLDKNIVLNNRENITTLNVALSNADSTETFYLNKKHGSNSLISKTDHPIQVPCFMLDTLAQYHKMKDINLVKIDVEGAEVEVVEGCKKLIEKHSPKFIIEVSSSENLKKILKLLKGYDYYNISGKDYCFIKRNK